MRVTTYVPGLIMLDEAFQFLGTQFVQWKVFAAYDILMFAVFAAGLSVLERKHWHIAVPTAAVMCLLPFLMTMYFREINMVTVYISAYADLPMGLLFGAPLALYFSQEEKTPAILWTCVMGVAFVSITKDTGLCPGPLAAAILCFDLIFVQAKNSVRLTGRVGGLAAKWTYSACLMLAPLCHLFWLGSAHGHDAGRQPFRIGRRPKHEPVQLLATGLGELFGINRTERFSRVMGEMWQAFYSTKAHHVQCGQPAGRRGPHCQRLGRRGGGAYSGHSAGGFSAGKGPQAPGIAWFSCGARWALPRIISSLASPMCMVLGSRRNDGLQPLYLPLPRAGCWRRLPFCGRIAARKARRADALGAAGADGGVRLARGHLCARRADGAERFDGRTFRAHEEHRKRRAGQGPAY